MVVVGIDVGKAALDMAVDGKSGVVQFANTPIEIRKLLRQLAAVASPCIVMHATDDWSTRSEWRSGNLAIPLVTGVRGEDTSRQSEGS